MNVKELATESISIETGLSGAEIASLCERASEAAAIRGTSSLRRIGSDESALIYEIVGPFKMVRQGRFAVHLTPSDSGGMRVRTELLSYLTLQSKTLFIPTGPKRMPAIKAYRKFMYALRTELSAGVRSEVV